MGIREKRARPKRAAGRPVLSLDALNRALLARQMLLERAEIGVAAAIERLVGLQAQSPQAAYVGLWSRVAGFDPMALSRMIEQREAVRMTVMRGTIHLVTARDALLLKPIVRPAIDRILAGNTVFRRAAEAVGVPALLAAGRDAFAQGPLTLAELRPMLAARWPDGDAVALSWNVHGRLDLVQVPPRGLWRRSGAPRWATVEAWLGEPVSADPTPDVMVLRYLAGFGPASVMDAQNWSGVTKLAAVFDRLRPELVTFTDESGRELFDLPDAPRPDADTPAPVRFLPEYDNATLGHADRSRIIRLKLQRPVRDNELMRPVLVDGIVAALWSIGVEKRAATLRIEPFRTLRKAEVAALEEEGGRLLAFVTPDAESLRVEWIPH